MIQDAALEALGLDEEASPAQIAEAISRKRAQLQQAQERAPTEALCSKYQQQLQKLEALEAELALKQRPTARKTPSLSQTKLADLPQSATQFDSGGASAQLNLQPGQVLANRYEIKEQIGSGGMGAVYQAFDRTKQEDIALKVLLPALLENERARQRFLDEARISAKLSHPNIVNVHDVQQDGDFFFLTMELLEGQDLRQLMEARQLSRQPFDEAEARTLAVTLANALAYAHRHTVHRDIKPENIWVTEAGDYKIMDFGIARVQSTSQRTQTGAAMGTAYYMAPEQLKGTSTIDGRADQYALGALLYELLAGEVPAGRFKPLRELRKDLGKGFAASVEKALETRAEDRFADMPAFAAALERNKGGGFELNLPWKGIGIAAGVLVALLGIGGLAASGSFDMEWLKKLLPMSKEEIATHKASLAKIQGEIKVLKQRLESGRRDLERDLRDAERNGGDELAALRDWQQQVDESVFSDSRITELEGDLAMAETLLRDNAFEQARPVFERVREGYAELLQRFAEARAEAKSKQLLVNNAMVRIPGGSFLMGSDSNGEKPVHRVTVKAFLMSKYEVTFAQYDAFAQATGRAKPSDKGWGRGSGWGRGNRPVINVSWEDANAYTQWLSRQTGKKFRLPSEAEWEYAARAGTSSSYSWGNTISCSKARYGRRKGGECSDSMGGPVPVGSFSANAFGLFDMHGNVGELVQDCWHSGYSGAPANGSARESYCEGVRVQRGGHWFSFPEELHSARRTGPKESDRNIFTGFRLAQNL